MVFDIQAPSQPSAVVSDFATATSISISWEESTDNGEIIGIPQQYQQQ